MEYLQLVDALEAQAIDLGEAASTALDQPVPGCPGWVGADVLSHMGRIYWWVAELIRLGGRPFEGERPDAPAAPQQRLEWYQTNLGAVLSEFRNHKADDPAWNFVASSPQEVWWWARRQAVETAIHRFDAQSARRDAGPPDPLPADLAVVGIDEFVMGILPMILRNRPAQGLKGTLHLHATDADGEWWIDFDSPELTTRREHSKADTALRGPASGLYLWTWNRQTAAEAGLQAFGDENILETWLDLKI